jgi:NADH-quinone oxidoreductase subunit I
MSLLKDIWSAVSGIGTGMTKTYDEQFDPVFTEMYPFEMPKLPPTSVQSLALIKNEDGSDRCVSCLACEKVCPSQVITIERKKNPAGKGFVLERFDIDLVNCMYCAACVESCPASAIVTIQDFEMSTPNLQTLKADKDYLDFQGLRSQQWYSPKIGVEYRHNASDTNIHGEIVKAGLEDQPGGLAELEKIRVEGGELPAPGPRAPALAMRELGPAAMIALKAEPIGLAAPKLETTAPAVIVAPVTPAPVTTAPAVTSAPTAEGGAPKSKKIKRWGEPNADDSSAATSSSDDSPEAGVEAAAPAASSAPEAKPVEAPANAETKPSNPKIKRWEPKQ